MRSMTGFGKGDIATNEYDLTVELRAVNHRFLDLNFKLPKSLSYVEDAIRKSMQLNVQRGHIDIFVTYKDKRRGGEIVTVDGGLASKYVSVAKDLHSEYNLPYDLTVTGLMRMPEVIITEVIECDDYDMTEAVVSCTETAIKSFNLMRETEGESIKVDLQGRLLAISSFVDEISERAPSVVDEYRMRLAERVKEALSGADIDESRLIQEVAIYCDKVNVDEEITRLRAHINQFGAFIGETIAIGRKLDFLVQEINRESNTIGSKCNDVYLTNRVVSLKNEIEKIREQIQNIE